MQYKKILTNQAVPGMISADDVYTFNNTLIIGKNTLLTDRIITRLKFYSVYEIIVFIEEEVKIIKSSEFTEDESPYKNKQKTLEFRKFLTSFKDNINNFKNSIDEVVINGTDINTDLLLNHTNNVLAESRNGLHVLNMLHSTRKFDDLTYVHSLNVSLICNVFGKWLKLSEEEIRILTLCGLLHDIGKVKIPSKIIDKPTKLTDVEFITVKMHTIKGYNILKNKNIDPRIINTALMHHERCDGSGYPNALTSNQIDKFAKIVAIADVYDAMTSARVYRGPLCPFEVIELFETEGYQKYDAHYLLTFLDGIVQTYMHNKVQLSTGQKGKIVMLNKNSLTKPVIQIGKSFMDLSKHPDVSILKVI